MSNTLEEKQLIQKAINGCNESFKFLIENEKAKFLSLKNMIPSITNEDFQDCFQNASYKSFNNLSKFNYKCSFNTWFYSILKNEILLLAKKKNLIKTNEFSIEDLRLNYHKSNDREQSNDELYDKICETEDNSYNFIFDKEKLDDYKKVLNHCFDKIDPKYKDVLNLAYIEKKSRKEISDILKIPIGSVLSRIFMANKRAKKIITFYVKQNNMKLEGLNV